MSYVKNRRKGEQALHKILLQKSNRWVKTIPKISMKQSPRIQSRKITDIIEKIVEIPEGKQNHKPGMHGFVVYDVVQVAVFYAFFPSTLVGWGGQYCHIFVF